ncbi:Methylenetetrahydrofolate reductase (NAD(P)H) [Saliniradius amylolyticus]|uniref:Methylenetetrahydrofolate reductase n=1 Tax=Saliniradius amylolyticus TaxID=2183582 RepID=A0A2S2E4G5_9ALTE|nr:methylenetetrahydrofolate reductase [NAD(P)H] [Saliniradius amylolyticus]AWL12545.1 Methylenetetrahydrofolate reductase (NAD(P)H) [Saliniradius amylolyticus]
MSKYADRQFSFEFFPPKTETGENKLKASLERLQRYSPEYVSVTFGAGGSTRERTLETVDWIKQNGRVDVAPHLSCIGSMEKDIEGILRQYREMGIKRIVALRGDIPEHGDAFIEGGFRYANELVGFIREFGGFEIHVGCYPEFHPESSSAKVDLDNFARKVKAGADEAITQYFFNNDAYYYFIDEIQKRGVEVPVHVGLMPITNYNQIRRFSDICGAEIPRWLSERMKDLGDDTQAQEDLGVEFATRQAEELLEQGAPGIHFYTLNNAGPTERIWRNLGLVDSTNHNDRT